MASRMSRPDGLEPVDRFINRYVFPDGQLDNISNIQRFMEDARFEITDVEALRAHYALTLRAWVARLERRHARALEYVSEATYRVWRLYMSACALEFESGHLGVYQVLASKRGPQHAAYRSRAPSVPAAGQRTCRCRINRAILQFRSAKVQLAAKKRSARPAVARPRSMIAKAAYFLAERRHFQPGTKWRIGWRRKPRSTGGWSASTPSR